MTEVMKELVKNVPGVLTDRSVKSLWTLLKRELEEGGGKGKCLCSVLSWVFLYGSFTVHWCLTQTQIMLARDSTGRKKFLVWESEENEFETLFQVLLKWPWNWLHKGTIHLILTKSYFCFNRRTQQLEIAYLPISNFLMVSNSNHFTMGIFFNIIYYWLSRTLVNQTFFCFLRDSGIQHKNKKTEQRSRRVYISSFDRSVMTSSNSVLKWLLIYNNRSFIEIQEKPFPYIMKGLGSRETHVTSSHPTRWAGRLNWTQIYVSKIVSL